MTKQITIYLKKTELEWLGQKTRQFNFSAWVRTKIREELESEKDGNNN